MSRIMTTTARLFAATAATAVALGAAACSAPLETIEDPATHKTTSQATVTVTESPATTAPRTSGTDTASVYQKGSELLSNLRAAGVPLYDLDAATVGKTGQEMCSALERDVPVQQLRALTVEQMGEFWDAEESDTFMVTTILTMCPEVIEDLN